MRKLVLLAVCVGLSAWAGEKHLGTIIVSDAGTVSNASTGYGSQGFANAFRVPTNAKLTIQCDEAAIVAVNSAGADAGTALVLTAAQIFPTSTGAAVTQKPLPDAGSYVGGLVAIAPANGATTARCRVFERSGTE